MLLSLAGYRGMSASLEEPSSSNIENTETISLRKARHHSQRSHQKLVDLLREVWPPVCLVPSNCEKIPCKSHTTSSVLLTGRTGILSL